MSASAIWTIGHSNRPITEFLEMLQGHAIKMVADVRRFPGSRRHPQFQQDNLKQSLQTVDIGYQHFSQLGGRRAGRAPSSPNGAWKVASFNAYADYMLTAPFEMALTELERLAGDTPTAIMCAEAVPWRCHRRLIADRLTVDGWEVHNIYTTKRSQRHQLTEFARVEQGQVTYPSLFPDEELD